MNRETPGGKRGKTQVAKRRKKPANSRVIVLSKAQLERGAKIGAKVDRAKNPTMLVYYRS